MGDTTEKAEKARGKKMDEKTEQTRAAPESKMETPVVTVDRDQEGPVFAMSRRRRWKIRELDRRMKIVAREIERKEGVGVFNVNEERKRLGILPARDWRRRLVHSSFKKGIYYYMLRWSFCGRKGCRYCPHGPYWFVVRRTNGKRIDKYIGKVLRMVDSQNEYSLDLD